MSARQQSKRATFARVQRTRRRVRKLYLANAHRVGFVGICTKLRITLAQANANSVVFDEVGAVFVENLKAAR